jgi:hypothetical protein
MSDNALFLIGFTFLLIHEMDAIRCKEWRIFPGLSLLSDKTGQLVFVIAHIPLLIIVWFQLTYNTENVAFIKWLDFFMIVHIALHLIFVKHKYNHFKDWISWTLILGAGLFGFADLLIKM